MGRRPALESLGLSFWQNRRVLVTGHTGFKGAWLALWLERLGARVVGLALPPATKPSLFELLSPWPALDHRVGDVTTEAVVGLIAESGAEIMVHMAAQSLVAVGHRDPRGTFATNVMGTVHALEGGLRTPSLRAALIVTTDKVYAHPESGRAFAEDDPLGGDEPYGASKAAAELAVNAYRARYAGKGIGLATARSGNVMGGGDWSEHRLVPDLVRALASGRPVGLRNPEAVRPWQHVLDPLAGYLLYAERLAQKPAEAPAALNFGPADADCRRALDVVERFLARFKDHPGWTPVGASFREAAMLRLSAAKAGAVLGWRPRLNFDDSVAWTADWYAAHREGALMRRATVAQIERYETLA